MSGGGGDGPQTPMNMGEDGFGFHFFGQSSSMGLGSTSFFICYLYLCLYTRCLRCFSPVVGMTKLH